MRIITSGFPYIDIDAYACCVAYAELLNLQGEVAKAVSTAKWNESITDTIRSWSTPFSTHYSISSEDTFTLTDVSDPGHFDAFVVVERVDKVIDHHPGFEEFWEKRIGEDKTRIDFIGAACSLVYEEWRDAGLLEKMSAISARLLVCGILDNTLNFGARVTTQRDRDAYEFLVQRAELPDDWTACYFSECQSAILNDAAKAITNDTKLLKFDSYGKRSIAVGQVVVWDGRQVLEQYGDLLKSTMASKQSEWFINLVSIEEGRSYFICDNPRLGEWLSELLDLQFDGSVAVTDRLWLRKEIIKQDILSRELTGHDRI